MCLIINLREHPDKKPKVAKKKIRCYKILVLVKGTNKYYTPIHGAEITSNTLKCDFFDDVPQEEEERYIFHGIHSFKNILSCFLYIMNLRLWTANTTKKLLIKKSIIPKGTNYWIGVIGDYCSERIIIKGLNI